MSNSLARKNEVGGGAAGGRTCFSLVSVGPANEIAVCPNKATTAETMRVLVLTVLIICTYLLVKARLRIRGRGLGLDGTVAEQEPKRKDLLFMRLGTGKGRSLKTPNAESES
jgi:hypothetical protein